MQSMKAGVKTRTALLVGVLLLACAFVPVPAEAQKKEIVQLQTTVTLLQQQVRELQRTLDERTAVLRTLVEQAVDAVNRMNQTVGELDRNLKEAQATSGARVDSLATEVRALRDTLDEMSVRVAKLSEQLVETRSVLQTVDARLAAPPPAPAESAPSVPPPTLPSADTLYTAAKRDLDGGKHDLARQQFADYLKYYGETPLAGNAQFYIGETYYQQKEYARAIEEYERVLTRHSKSYKAAAALLKKGYALIRLDEREAGIRSLRTVLREHPNSDEAKLARAELRRLGVSAPGAP